jgi:5-methylcytosine-specific restriction protein A
MPYKPKRPCAYPNCPELTDGRYCEKHAPKVNSDYNRYARDADSKCFYNSKAWRVLSKRQLRLEPLCAECLKAGRTQAAAIADHIRPIKRGGARLDIENLQSLCRACHNRKHGKN